MENTVDIELHAKICLKYFATFVDAPESLRGENLIGGEKYTAALSRKCLGIVFEGKLIFLCSLY